MFDTRSDQERAAGVPQPQKLTKKQLAWRKRYGHLIDPQLASAAVMASGGYGGRLMLDNTRNFGIIEETKFNKSRQ